MTAPIALFVYNRPDHTRRTVEALLRNELAAESDVYVFSDGPRSAVDAPMVDAVRTYLRTVGGFRSIKLMARPENFGLARSIITGVTELCQQEGRVIVLEDDLVTSPYFLRYMNEALDIYANAPQVASIHGYVYPVRGKLPESFFIRGGDCWGWATWKRAWTHFNPDGRVLLAELRRRKLDREFDFGGACGYTQMLEEQTQGKNESWAIRWSASAFLADMVTLYPGRSLVQNIGVDESGRHSDASRFWEVALSTSPIMIERLPACESPKARRAMASYFRWLGQSPVRALWSRAGRKIRSTARRLRRMIGGSP